jgi:hypothetical protein
MNIMVLLLDIAGRYGVSWPHVRGLMASIRLMARRAASGRIALLQSWCDLPHPCGTSVANMDLLRVRRRLP